MMQQKSPTNVVNSPETSWFYLLLACLAAIAGTLGVFEPGSTGPGVGLLLGIVIFVAGGWDVFRRIRGDLGEHYTGQIAGPTLWVVASWIIFRFGGGHAAQLVLLPAAVIAWLVATFSWKIFLFPLFIALIMEGGVLAAGRQSFETFIFNLACYGVAAIGLKVFANTAAYRQRVHMALTRAKRDAKTKEYARDLGLFGGEAPLGDTLPRSDSPDEPFFSDQAILETIADSFDLQLEMIRNALDLTTVAVFWPDPAGAEQRLRSIATIREDILPGPYPIGTGITGALTGPKNEVSMSSVSKNFSGLPYYRRQNVVGSIFAIRIHDAAVHAPYGDKKISAILCVDRVNESEWTETEREALRLAARKLSLDVVMGRRLQAMSRERSAIQQFCTIMRELNAVLDLGQVLETTIKAVGIVARADFIAVSLVQDGHHRIVYAVGKEAERLCGREFPVEEGLVGQVLKINRSLPAKAECYGPTAVFSNMKKLPGFRSLFIVPLRKEAGKPIGALTIAAAESGIFTIPRQEILELIATQVAIKIDLGQAHEQINKMATTDGLTELSNHRTFQHGFDVMIERAHRRKGKLCLLFADIDRFKQINDTYGHPFGDKALKGVAGVLKREVRVVDLAARYGGEEFAIVLEDSNGKGGFKVAERIRHEIEKMVFYHEREAVKITMSLGLAVYPNDGDEKSLLITRADQALYQAKQNGRNRTVVWDDKVKGAI